MKKQLFHYKMCQILTEKKHPKVAMLSDQIDSQSDKILDLEKILDDKKDVLRKTEDILQREMLSRFAHEQNDAYFYFHKHEKLFHAGHPWRPRSWN